MNKRFQIATDSAAVAIFDPTLISHRRDDSDDWWTLWDDSLLEMNAGRIVLCKLPGDGTYRISLQIRFPWGRKRWWRVW